MAKRFLFALMLIVSSYGYSQEGDSLIKVTDKLYVVQGLGGNVTLFLTNEGVVVIDAGMLEKDGKRIGEIAKKLTDKPIKYVIVTNYHYDHAFGVCGIEGKPIIVGHENLAKSLKEKGTGSFTYYRDHELKPKVELMKRTMDSLKQANNPEWKNTEVQYTKQTCCLENAGKTIIEMPDTSFSTTMDITLGGEHIHLVYPGCTYTDCNIIVEIVSQKALITGDFYLNKSIPYIGFNDHCDTKNWISKLNEYSLKPYLFVIPGHGLVSNTAGMKEEGEYLKELRETIAGKIKENKTLDQIKGEITMAKLSYSGFQFMLASQIEAIYNEITSK